MKFVFVKSKVCVSLEVDEVMRDVRCHTPFLAYYLIICTLNFSYILLTLFSVARPKSQQHIVMCAWLINKSSTYVQGLSLFDLVTHAVHIITLSMLCTRCCLEELVRLVWIYLVFENIGERNTGIAYHLSAVKVTVCSFPATEIVQHHASIRRVNMVSDNFT